MNILAHTDLSNSAGVLLCPAGHVVTRQTIPSTDETVALLAEQGILSLTDAPVTWPPSAGPGLIEPVTPDEDEEDEWPS